MSEIKHLSYENATEQIFTLTVTDGAHAGVYEIEKPDGFDEADIIVDINEDYFNIDNFILGETEKINFLQYSNGLAYDIVKKVYEEQGSDGRIVFGWQAVNGTNNYDLLGDGYELNLNKYKNTFEKSMMKIETEIKKREVENKFLTREDVSVNLFSEKDLDNLPADPLILEDAYYKEGVRKKGNFYFFDLNQPMMGSVAFFLGYTDVWQFVYTRSDGAEIGDNANTSSGYLCFFATQSKYQGVMLSTLSGLPDVKIEISNMWVMAVRKVSDGNRPNFEMNAVIKNGATVVRKIHLEDFTDIANADDSTRQELKILNKVYKVGALSPNESIELLYESKDGVRAGFFAPDTNTSIEITSNLSTPLKKIKMLRLKPAIERLARLYSGVDLPVQSTVLSAGGYYYNTAVSTGFFMRGLPDVYNPNKITTSFKTLFYESASKLLALGFDLHDDKIVIEDISYFFKNIETYDFTDKAIIDEGYSTENDVDDSYNHLIFGSKKFSTNKRSDLLNYNTKIEALTPLKSVKTKFDKQTDAIIDEYKIAELVTDKSTSTNNNDDDLVMIDMVHVDNYIDEGVLTDATHMEEDGYLWIYSYEVPFDILPISVGGNLEITSGLNTGTWGILEINKYKIKLNKTSGIQTGNSETPVRFVVSDILKNRTNEGFATPIVGVSNELSATNLRHNPKYQMARWFPFYGPGLSKKADTEEIIVTDYKNNGDVILEPISPELENELQGETELKANETLERLRENREVFFTGEKVEVTLHNVLFYEFFACFNEWRYGEKNRGYISVTVPEGTLHIYPFASKGFDFKGKFNELTIRGKKKALLPPID